MPFKNSTRPFFKRDVLEATATLDFPSIAAGATATLTITVKGALAGDPVTAHATSAPTAGLVYDAYVSAADTVTVRATNVTGLAVDAASVSWVALVIQSD